MMSFARRTSSRGMTLIEILIGLSIAALLLVAVASALMTALRSVGVNEQHVRSRQSAGAALNYMLARIRTAKELTLSPSDADDSAYTDLVTLDEGDRGVIDGVDQWVRGECTHFYEAEGALWVQKQHFDLSATPTTTSDAAVKILHNVENLKFMSRPDGGTHESVTVEMNIQVRDSISSGSQASNYAIAGTAYARSML